MEGVELIKVDTARTLWDMPWNINLNFKNEKQHCKIGTVCVYGGEFLEGKGE
jgi:hypothetical protein